MEGQVISDNGENREIGKRMKGRDSGDRDNREDTGMEGGGIKARNGEGTGMEGGRRKREMENRDRVKEKTGRRREISSRPVAVPKAGLEPARL